MKKFKLHYYIRNDEGNPVVRFCESYDEAFTKDKEQQKSIHSWPDDTWMAEDIYVDEQGKLYFKKSSLSIREDGKRVYLEED